MLFTISTTGNDLVFCILLNIYEHKRQINFPSEGNMKYSLQKKLIVKENSDFQKIYRCGRSLANKNMVMYYCKAFHPSHKVAFAAGKKLGNAVTRNRVKRLLREVYRLHRHEIKDDYCLLLVGRAAAVDLKSTALEKSFYSLCKRANILKKEVEMLYHLFYQTNTDNKIYYNRRKSRFYR